jgi:hypothetical protein
MVDRFGLAPLGHGRDQEILAVHDVVDDRHGRAVFLARVTEYAGAVVPNKLPAFVLVHGALLRVHLVAPARSAAQVTW